MEAKIQDGFNAITYLTTTIDTHLVNSYAQQLYFLWYNRKTGSNLSVGRTKWPKRMLFSVAPPINSILYPYANLFQLEAMNYMIAAIVKDAPENRVSLANHKCWFLCWVRLSWFDKWRYIISYSHWLIILFVNQTMDKFFIFGSAFDCLLFIINT